VIVKKIIGPVFFTDSNSCPDIKLILPALFTVYTEGNKIGYSIFSACTERQYTKKIFAVARCGSSNQHLLMVHALRCSTKLHSYSSRTLWAVCFQNSG
jgi:hypothetical protein